MYIYYIILYIAYSNLLILRIFAVFSTAHSIQIAYRFLFCTLAQIEAMPFDRTFPFSKIWRRVFHVFHTFICTQFSTWIVHSWTRLASRATLSDHRRRGRDAKRRDAKRANERTRVEYKMFASVVKTESYCACMRGHGNTQRYLTRQLFEADDAACNVGLSEDGACNTRRCGLPIFRFHRDRRGSPTKRSRIRRVREKAHFSVELMLDMRLIGLGEILRWTIHKN